MDGDKLERLAQHFGQEITDREWRESSYGLLESYVTQATSQDGSVKTAPAVDALRSHLEQLSDPHFAFLLTHCGYIPDHYSADSSQETLHTKLTEAVVCEWGRRLGYDASLQKEKSSKEDVTFKYEGKVIVCDAKSFRLGRSQAAPNVKDAVKQGDYRKWLRNYSEASRAGGLLAFPSKHDWKRSSDVYAYVSNPKDPILLLFYEHMAYLILHRQNAGVRGGIFGLVEDYPSLFASPSKSRERYWSVVDPEISRMASADNFIEIRPLLTDIVEDAVIWAFARIDARVTSIYETIRQEVKKIPELVIREQLVESLAARQTKDLRRCEENIKKFRL